MTTLIRQLFLDRLLGIFCDTLSTIDNALVEIVQGGALLFLLWWIVVLF